MSTRSLSKISCPFRDPPDRNGRTGRSMVSENKSETWRRDSTINVKRSGGGRSSGNTYEKERDLRQDKIGNENTRTIEDEKEIYRKDHTEDLRPLKGTGGNG